MKVTAIAEGIRATRLAIGLERLEASADESEYAGRNQYRAYGGT